MAGIGLRVYEPTLEEERQRNATVWCGVPSLDFHVCMFNLLIQTRLVLDMEVWALITIMPQNRYPTEQVEQTGQGHITSHKPSRSQEIMLMSLSPIFAFVAIFSTGEPSSLF
jgi:hypothetical protein